MSAPARVGLLAILLWVAPGFAAVGSYGIAPDFSLPLIQAPEQVGNRVAWGADPMRMRLADYRGAVVYVDFWSAWCSPCRDALPLLSALRDAQPSGQFEVLSVNVDSLVEDAMRVLASVAVSYPVASDVLQTSTEAYGVMALPAGVLIDAEGNVRGLWQGEAAVDYERLRRDVRFLVSGGAGIE